MENTMKTTKLRSAVLALALTIALTSQANAAPASRASLVALFQLQHADTMALVRAEYNWAVIEPAMIDAYQKTFTEEEITAMINFYSTPAGQAAITKIPQLMQIVMAGSQVHIQALLPRIQAISEKARADADADAADAAH
jgi:uncharacterized protein